MTSRAREWWAAHRPGRRQPVTLALMLVLALVVAWTIWDRAQADQEAELAKENAAAIAEQVRAECQRQGEVARLLGDICRQADEVAQEPAEPVVTAPTDEQLRPLVQQYVAEWLAANPPPPGRDGESISIAEITDLITDLVVAEVAGVPRPPTLAQVRVMVVEEVAAFLNANPPLPGQDGQDGQDGADGVDGQDGADGADGAPGPPGPTCPEGTTLREREMPLQGETWFVCVEDEEGT